MPAGVALDDAADGAGEGEMESGMAANGGSGAMSGNVVPGPGEGTWLAMRTPLACGAALAIAVGAVGGGSLVAVLPHATSASSIA